MNIKTTISCSAAEGNEIQSRRIFWPLGRGKGPNYTVKIWGKDQRSAGKPQILSASLSIVENGQTATLIEVNDFILHSKIDPTSDLAFLELASQCKGISKDKVINSNLSAFAAGVQGRYGALAEEERIALGIRNRKAIKDRGDFFPRRRAYNRFLVARHDGGMEVYVGSSQTCLTGCQSNAYHYTTRAEADAFITALSGPVRPPMEYIIRNYTAKSFGLVPVDGGWVIKVKAGFRVRYISPSRDWYDEAANCPRFTSSADADQAKNMLIKEMEEAVAERINSCEFTASSGRNLGYGYYVSIQPSDNSDSYYIRANGEIATRYRNYDDYFRSAAQAETVATRFNAMSRQQRSEIVAGQRMPAVLMGGL